MLFHNHHHQHHLSIMETGHLLTQCDLTHPEVSSMVSPGSFCLWVCSILLSLVICCEAFCLHVVSHFFCSPVLSPKLGLYLIPLQSLYLIYSLSKCCFSHIFHLSCCYTSCISCLNDTVQQIWMGQRIVYFTLVIFKVFCGLNILLIRPVFSNSYAICYKCPLLFHKISIS